MKKLLALQVVLLLFACKKEPVGNSFTSSVAGIWTPYQINYADGTIQKSEMTANSIFGAYDESVMLNSDQTFVPGTIRNGTFYADSLEVGTYSFNSSTKLIHFDGPLQSEFMLIAFTENELRLSSGDTPVVYYFRRRR